VCRGFKWVQVFIVLEMSFLPGHLALSVGVAERDQQAGGSGMGGMVGELQTQPARQESIVSRVGRVGEREKNRSEVADGRKLASVKLRHRYSIS
jgi:hypothetical protein